VRQTDRQTETDQCSGVNGAVVFQQYLGRSDVATMCRHVQSRQVVLTHTHTRARAHKQCLRLQCFTWIWRYINFITYLHTHLLHYVCLLWNYPVQHGVQQIEEMEFGFYYFIITILLLVY